MTNTIPSVLFLVIIFAHFLGDFVFQSHWMSQNKSKRMDALVSHTVVYGVVLLATISVFMYPVAIVRETLGGWFLVWLALNVFLHGLTDFVTARLSSMYFGKDWHNFFVIVGGDQATHYMTMLVSLQLFWNLALLFP